MEGEVKLFVTSRRRHIDEQYKKGVMREVDVIKFGGQQPGELFTYTLTLGR